MLTSKIKSARLIDLLCLALLLSFAIIIAYPRWRAWIDWRDEGLLAYGAVRVMTGEIPHRDFVSLQPPLSYYTSAAVFKVFGTSLLSLRVFGLSIFLLLPLLIYSTGRNFIGPILCFAAAASACVLGLPYFRFVPFAVWQGITVSFAAALLFIPALSKRQWLAFPAGLLSAISLFLRQDQAVYTAIAIFVLVVATSFTGSVPRNNLQRALLLWLAGIAIVSIPLVVVWWRIGALPEMFRQLIVFPFATYRKTSALPFPILFGQRSCLDAATALLFYLPPLVQAIGSLYIVRSIIRRRFRLREAILTFFVVWSALFYFQVLVRSDLTHLLITLPPFFLLTAFGWSIVREKITHRRTVEMVLSVSLSIFIALFLWILRPVLLPDMSQATELLNLKRGGVRVAKAPVIANLFQSLQTAVPPNRSILALPYQPMFYFLAERRNPTRWNYLWPGDQTARDYENLIAQAERDPPAVVLLSERRAVATFAPTILGYIEAHYDLTDTVGDINVYVRRESN
ncbi:MAG TPA: hypothetical protein VEI58_08860 [Chthoniobacterales bacterium]|nr:hypothetical protein [Chthoniobacterales bacterium]